MKYKTLIKTEHTYPLIELISDECIERLSKIYAVHLTREKIKNRIKVLRGEEKPGFFRRLMEQIPGFDKRKEGA